jgi:hypothetical protein
MKVFSKRLLSCSLFLLLVFTGSAGIMALEGPPAEIIDAAQKGIDDFVKAEKANTNVSVTTSSIMMVEKGKLDLGFEVFTISPAAFMMGTDMNKLITSTGLWRFVVVNNNQPVSLITVAPVEGKWRAVTLGASKLAVEVFKVLRKWPVEEGYNYRFVRVFQARTDLMQISRNGNPIGFVPLTSARMAFKIHGDFDPAILLASKEICEPLKKIVNDSLTGLETGK